MSFLSNALKKVAPVVATVAPIIPGGQAIAIAATAKTAADQRAAAKYQQALQQQEIERFNKMAIGDPNFPGAFPIARPASIGQPGFFDRLGGIASNVGSTLLTGLESAVPSVINRAIFGDSRPVSAAQGPAVTSITNVGAQESQGSGSIQAGAGALLPSILGGARSLLKSPAGMIVNMVGGDLSAASGILGIDEQTLVMILLKRFRNDGPVVTKAALRKTKSTISRLHNMQDVLKSITPTAAGRRRAPTKRGMTTTLIKN